MQSVSTENFIKAIYQLSLHSSERVKTSELSNKLNISNAAISDMARKLFDRKLINYEKYNGIILTKEGEKVALNVLRKHRLWETFLHNVLKLSKHEIHQEAEVLEHVTSDFLADKLDDFLGRPEKDPHGAPIPDSEGNIVYDENIIALSQALTDEKYRIVRLSATDSDFYEFCQDNQIEIGTELKILKQYVKSEMTTIEIKKSKLMLHYTIAKKIFITNV